MAPASYRGSRNPMVCIGMPDEFNDHIPISNALEHSKGLGDGYTSVLVGD